MTLDIGNFLTINKDAMLLYYTATQDYLGCRCCILNTLLYPGLALGSQAIEKALKSLIKFHRPTEDYKKYNHNLNKLYKALEQIQEHDFGLSTYKDFLNILIGHYNWRYHDSDSSSKSMSSKDLDEIDNLFFHISEILPIPKEIKVSCGIYAVLFQCGDLLKNQRQILLIDNHVIRNNVENLYKSYDIYRKK